MYPTTPTHTQLADYLAVRGPKQVPTRLRLKSGEELLVRDPHFDDDKLTLWVTCLDGTAREIAPVDIAEVTERRANWVTRAGLAALAVAAGALAGAIVLRGVSELSLKDSLFLGGLAGSFLAPVMIWVCQGMRFFARWNRVVPRPPSN
jgi:hypothetical protein